MKKYKNMKMKMLPETSEQLIAERHSAKMTAIIFVVPFVLSIAFSIAALCMGHKGTSIQFLIYALFNIGCIMVAIVDNNHIEQLISAQATIEKQARIIQELREFRAQVQIEDEMGEWNIKLLQYTADYLRSTCSCATKIQDGKIIIIGKIHGYESRTR